MIMYLTKILIQKFENNCNIKLSKDKCIKIWRQKSPNLNEVEIYKRKISREKVRTHVIDQEKKQVPKKLFF